MWLWGCSAEGMDAKVANKVGVWQGERQQQGLGRREGWGGVGRLWQSRHRDLESMEGISGGDWERGSASELAMV